MATGMMVHGRMASSMATERLLSLQEMCLPALGAMTEYRVTRSASFCSKTVRAMKVQEIFSGENISCLAKVPSNIPMV